MGYELHIARGSSGTSSGDISLEEWKEYIKSDDSLIEKAEDAGVYLWMAHPLGGIEGQKPWLRYGEGQISTRKPDEFLTLKMFEIAEKLHANVSNDEDILDLAYKEELEVDIQKILARHQRKSSSKSWWKFW